MSENSASPSSDFKGFPRTSLSLLIAGCLGFVVLFVFESAIRRYDILDRESAAWACFAAIALGSLVGFCSWRTHRGKLAALLGLVIVLALLAWVGSSSDDLQSPPPRDKILSEEKEAPNNEQPQGPATPAQLR